jgi:hypothetical protein
MSERMNNMQDNSRQRVRQEEGKVNIEYIPEKDKEKAQSECNSGEYVDFEEID